MDISTNLKNQHKSQHKTEKEFEKGLEKGRVSKTKRLEGEKSVRKTGYIKFCATMRPILKESQNPNHKQMMSLLGIEWRKLTKEQQQEWNKKAAEESTDVVNLPTASETAVSDQGSVDTAQETAVPELVVAGSAQHEAEAEKFFCPFCEVHKGTKALLKDHIANIHIQLEGNKANKSGNQLNRIPVPINQERISKCNVCEKMVNRNELENHMTTNHSENPATLEEATENQLFDEISVDEAENQLFEEVAAVDEADEVDEVREVATDHPKVVMIKRKTLWWPAKLIKEDHENATVTLLNQNKTKITTTKDKIKPFAVDHSQLEGMKRDWRDAYMKAVKLVSES